MPQLFKCVCRQVITIRLLVLFTFIKLLSTELSWAAVNQPEKSVTPAPVRVAALNWTQAEMLLTLEVVPAGVTSIKGYQRWQSGDPAIPESVKELGQRAEPGLEAIAALKPDLILGYKWRHSRIISELNQIAPTVLFQQYPNSEDPASYYVRMQSVFRSVAHLLGREQLAEQKLQEMQTALKQARKAIRGNGLQGHKVVAGKFVGMGLGLRVYSDQSLTGAIVNELGLVNSWQTSLPGRDFTHIDLLKLTTIGDASLIIIGSQPDKLPEMTRSPVWQALPAVKEGRVYYLPSLWSFGGPVSAARMASALVEQLVPEA